MNFELFHKLNKVGANIPLNIHDLNLNDEDEVIARKARLINQKANTLVNLKTDLYCYHFDRTWPPLRKLQEPDIELASETR